LIGVFIDGSSRGDLSGSGPNSLQSSGAGGVGIKKRRKSRTAFTNKQIYELEKRFLYQKYLTPADRDEIAQSLSLSNAQVITWFQNRRAKLKRDVEELKADMKAAKALGTEPAPNAALLISSLDELLLKGARGGGASSGKKSNKHKVAPVTSLSTSSPSSLTSSAAPVSDTLTSGDSHLSAAGDGSAS